MDDMETVDVVIQNKVRELRGSRSAIGCPRGDKQRRQLRVLNDPKSETMEGWWL